MLHVSETWPVRKENKVALQQAEMIMVRWMCGVKVKDRFPSDKLGERLRIDHMISVLQQDRLQRYQHVLQKEDNNSEKKCMKFQTKRKTRGLGDRLWKKTVKHTEHGLY